MALDELNNQLYSRDHAKDREKVENLYEPGGDLKNVSHIEIDGEDWKPITHQEKLSEKIEFWWAENKRRVIIGACIVLALGGAVFFGYQWYKKFFSEGNTVVTIAASDEVKSGEMLPVTVKVTNENRTVLENVKISLEYGSSFSPEVPYAGWQVNGGRAEIAVGELAPGESKEVTLSGKLFASKGSVAIFKTVAQYNPQKISGVYEARNEREVRVLSSPLTLEVKAPQQLVTGQPLDYELVYKNESNNVLDNIRIKATFPEGFTFTGASPPTAARDIWILGTFRPGDSGKIVVSGTLSGVWNEKKEVKFSLGYETGDGKFVTYNEGVAITQIIASPLSVKQVANEEAKLTANPGDILTYTIEYKNNGDQGVREAIITTRFENPEFLDWQNLDLPRGYFDEANKQLIWKASDIPELRTLAPGQGGTLNFTVPVISDFSTQGVVKNKAIVSETTIDSPDLAGTLSQNKLVGSNKLVVTLGTLVGFQAFAYYNDDSTIDNEGPVPPEVGETTQYSLRFRVSNPANEVSNGKVVVTLPTYMKYTETKFPEAATLEYKERTNELIWTVGTVSPGAPQELRAQVEFRPISNQANKEFIFFNKALFTARDNFAKQDIILELDEKTSFLPEDTGLPVNASVVVKRGD
jgi:hypothetical protein